MLPRMSLCESMLSPLGLLKEAPLLSFAEPARCFGSLRHLDLII